MVTFRQPQRPAVKEVTYKTYIPFERGEQALFHCALHYSRVFTHQPHWRRTLYRYIAQVGHDADLASCGG